MALIHTLILSDFFPLGNKDEDNNNNDNDNDDDNNNDNNKERMNERKVKS